MNGNKPWTNPSMDIDLSNEPVYSNYLDGTTSRGNNNDASSNAASSSSNTVPPPPIEPASYITRTTDSNGPCSNDGTNWADKTQPCPGATITYLDILGGAVNNGNNGNGAANSNGGGGSNGGEVYSTSGSEDIDRPNIDEGEGEGEGEEGSSSSPFTDNDGGTSTSTTSSSGGVDTTTNNFNGSDFKIIDGTSYPTYYSCTASEIDLSSSRSTIVVGAGGGSVDEVPITFNYEVYTTIMNNNDNDEEEIENVVSNFERQLAHGVASSLGLVDCSSTTADDNGELVTSIALRSNTDSTESGGEGSSSEVPFAGVFGNGGGGNRRSLLMTAAGEGDEKKGISMGEKKKRMLASGYSSSTIVGISMNPVDRVDTDIETCTSSATLSTSSSTTSCSPIAGAMTAWLTSSQRRQLRQLAESTHVSQETLILNSVQSYIEQNQDSYLNENLLHVSYIGPRSNDNGVNMSIKPAEATNGVNPGYIGIAVAAVVVLVALAGVLYKRRRQQRRNSSRRTSQEVDNDMGLFPHAAGLTPETHSNRPSTADTNDLNGGGGGNNLFGLTGARSDDEESSMEEGKSSMTKHSSLAALGAASTLVASSRYSPTSSPTNGGNNEQDDVHESNSFDMTPVSPQDGNDDEEASRASSEANSSVFDSVNDSAAHHIGTVSEDTNDAWEKERSLLQNNDTVPVLPGQAISPSESTVHISNESGVFAGAAVPMPHEEYSSSSDDDEPGLV